MIVALLKRMTPRPVAPAARFIYHTLYRAWIRCLIWCAGLSDSRQTRRSGFPRLPPAALRYRVGESPWLETFLKVGEKCSRHLESSLEKAGRPLDTFDTVLDFGCGCGRTLIWLARAHQRVQFCGTDTDTEAVNWCREHLPFARFSTNAALPPLEFSDAAFDLVYAISVFTHLDEDFQLRWLEELRRILRPAGLLLFTVHGEAARTGLDQSQIQELERHGFLSLRSSKLKGFFPDWYQTSYHTQAYVFEKLGRHLVITDYFPEGMGYQDIVIARR